MAQWWVVAVIVLVVLGLFYFTNNNEYLKTGGPAGNSIGYEVRPLYATSMFGTNDILDVRYTLKEGKILVYLNLDPTIERQRTS